MINQECELREQYLFCTNSLDEFCTRNGPSLHNLKPVSSPSTKPGMITSLLQQPGSTAGGNGKEEGCSSYSAAPLFLSDCRTSVLLQERSWNPVILLRGDTNTNTILNLPHHLVLRFPSEHSEP